ncbi:MAG: hypothetical protein JXB32_24865 [Deltaproteobacteria bacterium]|nr:hypothetical protein [Deltaproteobacteria bacterium]
MNRTFKIGIVDMVVALAIIVASVACLFAGSGCSSLIPSGRTPTDECRQMDDSYLAWHAVGVAAGGAAGATGAGGVLTSTLADEPGADIALAASSALFGILATVASVLSAEYAERAADACVEAPVP